MENQLLQNRLDEAIARIRTLEEENSQLRAKYNNLVAASPHSNAAINIEARIKAFRLEEERDGVVENMQALKIRYSKLHDAYLEKVKRCKALEDMFQRQKSLSGLVIKSAIEQRVKEQKLLQQTPHNEVQWQERVKMMQAALDESYDIISDMDFELESIDLLEMQNQSLQKELRELKENISAGNSSESQNTKSPAAIFQAECDILRAMPTNRHSTECFSCLNINDADSDSLERAAMTTTLLETAEKESNLLRRELLRSRLFNTMRKKNCS